MALVPVRIHFRLFDIEHHQKRVGAPVSSGGIIPTYLWTVFFKVDGDTTFVDNDFMVHGTATVVGTQGDHGDLPSDALSSITSIPSQIGEFRTVLTPIPVRPTGTTVPGAVGGLALLIISGDTPADAVAQGLQTLNSSLQNELNTKISTLGLMKQTLTDSDIKDMRDRIENAVHSAIKSHLSTWEKILAFFGRGDIAVDSAIYHFEADDLMTSAPEGIPLQNGYPNPHEITYLVGGPGAGLVEFWTFHGLIIADPLPLSLRRVLVGRGYQQPFPGLREAMGQSPSVSAWIATVR